MMLWGSEEETPYWLVSPLSSAFRSPSSFGTKARKLGQETPSTGNVEWGLYLIKSLHFKVTSMSYFAWYMSE